MISTVRPFSAYAMAARSQARFGGSLSTPTSTSTPGEYIDQFPKNLKDTVAWSNFLQYLQNHQIPKDVINLVIPGFPRNALGLAIMEGPEKIVETLLQRDNCNPNATDAYDLSAIELAAAKNSLPLVRLILKRPDLTPETVQRALKLSQTLTSPKKSKEIQRLLQERLNAGSSNHTKAANGS